jgi:hypothetical protein
VFEHAAVRLIRITHVTGGAMLTVHGPGGATAVYTCSTQWECLQKQQEIESTLGAAGYSRYPSDDRRTGGDRRRFPRGDRRRPSTYN